MITVTPEEHAALIAEALSNIDILNIALKHCDQEESHDLHLELKIQQIALASMKAKAVGYVSDVSRAIAEDGRLGYISNHCVAGLNGGYVYDAPPVPVIRMPTEYKFNVDMDIGAKHGREVGYKQAIEDIKRLNSTAALIHPVELPPVEKWRSVDQARAQQAYRTLVANAISAAGGSVKE